jgi:hypothetical protein
MTFAKHNNPNTEPPKHEYHKPTPGGFVPPVNQGNVTRIVIRAPIGGKFSFWGQDMYLEIQKGKEQEAVEFMRNWVETYVVYIAQYYTDLEKQMQAEKAGTSATSKEENNGFEKE